MVEAEWAPSLAFGLDKYAPYNLKTILNLLELPVYHLIDASIIDLFWPDTPSPLMLNSVL